MYILYGTSPLFPGHSVKRANHLVQHPQEAKAQETRSPQGQNDVWIGEELPGSGSGVQTSCAEPLALSFGQGKGMLNVGMKFFILNIILSFKFKEPSIIFLRKHFTALSVKNA